MRAMHSMPPSTAPYSRSTRARSSAVGKIERITTRVPSPSGVKVTVL